MARPAHLSNFVDLLLSAFRSLEDEDEFLLLGSLPWTSYAFEISQDSCYRPAIFVPKILVKTPTLWFAGCGQRRSVLALGCLSLQSVVWGVKDMVVCPIVAWLLDIYARTSSRLDLVPVMSNCK